MQVTELIKMESLILQTLEFRLMRPNAYSMLCLLRQALTVGKRDAALAMYLTARYSSPILNFKAFSKQLF